MHKPQSDNQDLYRGNTHRAGPENLSTVKTATGEALVMGRASSPVHPCYSINTQYIVVDLYNNCTLRTIVDDRAKSKKIQGFVW